MLTPQAAQAAVEAVRRHFASRLAGGREVPAVAAELENVLTLLAGVDFSRADEKHLQPGNHPVIDQLWQIDAQNDTSAASTRTVFDAFLPYLDALPWRYSYASRADAPDIGARMAWAELVGPVAPFHSHAVCLGLTAIGPHLLYPSHYHPAVETYLVVSGAAAWTAGGVTRRQAPGALILHPSNIVHAMQTGDEALLAAYAWTGDVETLSAYAAS
jgi:quercetin dioxygenase-like cupin family protein